MGRVDFLLSVLSVVLLFSSHITYATDVIPEKDLQRSLQESKAIVVKIREQLKAGNPVATEVLQLKTIAEDIKATNLLFEERFRLREEELQALGGKAIERHRMMSEGYRKALEEYLSLIDSLPPDGIIPEAAIDDLHSLLERIFPKRKLPIFGALPYRHLNYPSKEPLRTSAIAPAYKAGNTSVTPDDLKSTKEAPISEKIATLAQSLNWNPVSIYEWVKNGVGTEWYWGCMKGAEETLGQMSGNDCDQAALLVALLRASGYPSRYVRGVIEIEADRLKNLIGTDDTNLMAKFLQASGIPFTPVIKGGKIDAFEIEHIWVESEIPFANFHGAVVDEHGKSWLGLDTSIKAAGYTYTSTIDLFRGFSLSGMRDEYIGASQDDTPLEYIRSAVNAYLGQNYPDKVYEDALRIKSLIPEVMQILPASLQYREVVVTYEYSVIPDDLIHRVRFLATDMSDKELINVTLVALELSNQRIAITYEPETVEDQEIIDSYGGLDYTPAYLVKLRPVLTVNGEMVAAGKDGLPMGTDYNLTMELISPHGSEKITNTLITGNLSVIGIVAQKALSDQVSDGGIDAESLLYKEAINYIDRWDQAEEELASLMQLSIARPLPALVTIGGVIDVTYLLDIPHGFQWKGLYVDASLRAIETAPGSASGNERQKTFMQLSALQGSVLENKIFEDDFQVESISTAKLFGLTHDAQPAIEILSIDKTNMNDILPTLPFDDSIKEDIQNAVNQNLTIFIPQSVMTYENWTGIGYIKEDPFTGEGGYMLSGMIAGGMTAGDWPDDLLALLSDPYSKPPNKDPGAAYQIYKIADTDLQNGTVGEKLAKPFKVMVLDIKGKPVIGAPVTFTVQAGEGKAGVPGGGAVTVVTDGKGIASSEFTLGEKTGVNPRYIWKNPADEYSQQVGENIVNASISSGKSLAKPFTAYGFPKEPSALTKRFGDFLIGKILTFGSFVQVVAEDMYGNPVSNIPVDFTVLPFKELGACSNPNQDTRPTVLLDKNDPCLELPVVPTWGECPTAKASMQEKTSPSGAFVHLLMGGVPNAEYPIKASYGSLSTVFSRRTEPFGSCDDQNADPSLQLLLQYIYPADSFGNNIDGVGVDQDITYYIRLYFLREAEKTGMDCAGQCPKIVGARQYGIDTNFEDITPSLPGLQPCTPIGVGMYECQQKVSRGLNTISLFGEATIKRLKYDNHCPSCGPLIQETVDRTATNTMEVYGVDVKLTLGPDAPVMVDENGYSIKDYTLTSDIYPPEYRAGSANVVIKKDGEAVQFVRTNTSGTGVVTLLKGYYFEPGSIYTAQVVLNSGIVHQGRSLEIWSDEIPLTYSGKISAEDVRLSTKIDRINGDICGSPDYLHFFIADDANVTIEVDGAVLQETVGSQTTTWNDIPLPAGHHNVLISGDNVPLPGEHDFKITAVFTKTSPATQASAEGKILHDVTIDAFLPVGHTFVKGVSLQGGYLTYSSEDISIPGMGPDLTVVRSYASTGNSSSGPVGANWTHNYNSKLIIDECQRITVEGGEGSGIRFSNPTSQGGDTYYKPQRGYHGSLVLHSDGTYDFYTKGMTRYHYEQSPDPAKFTAKSQEYTLRFVEDTNGNRLTLAYHNTPPFNLSTVTDASGRALTFTYEKFGTVPEERIVKITGPLNLEVTFEYDQYGNLTKASRSTRTEKYDYTSTQKIDRHNLTKVTDPNGNVTDFIYYTDQDSISGYPANYDWKTHVLIYPEKYEYVKKVTEGAGTVDETSTSFKYDYINDSRTVNNGRGYDVVYKLNSYGSVSEVKDPLGNVTKTKWAMDAGIDDVYVVEKTDAEGNTTKYEYDTNGNVTKTTDALGYVSQAEYDLTFSKPTKTTDANNHSTRYTYDGNGNLLETKDPRGFITLNTYDARGNRETTTDANNKMTVFTYDQFGNIKTMKAPEGGVTTNTFDERSRLREIIDANNHKVTYSYDELDRQTESIDPLGHSTKYTFYDNGNKKSETNARGYSTTFSYDALNRLSQETDAYGNSTQYEYDKNSNKVKQTDRRRKGTFYYYDAADRLERQVSPENKEMTFTYDNVSNIKTETNFNGYTTTYDYDDVSRIVKVTDAKNNFTVHEYDAVGNRTKTTDPKNHATTFSYDENNRLTSRIDARGNASIITYDPVGNKKTETDRNNHTTTFNYDGNNRLVSVVDPLNYTVSHTYDDVGNKKTETDKNGNTTTFEYDELNRLYRQIDPYGNFIRYQYDSVGNIENIRDKRGYETIMEYDRLNRLSKAKVADPNTGQLIDVAYTYDENGNKKTEKNRRGFTTIYEYDDMNRLKTITDPLGQTVTTEYDGMGNITKVIDKKKIETTYIYDELNRLWKEIRKGITIRLLNYDPAGNLNDETDANLHTAYYEYDELNRLVKKIIPLNIVTSYTYDNEHNMLTETDPETNTTVRTYDELNRLKTVQDPENRITTYDYDGVGNTTKITRPKGNSYTTDYLYDKNNRLTTVTDAYGNLTIYTYDENGNLKSEEDANGQLVTFDYDSMNRKMRMTQFKSGGNAVTDYVYDENGNRTELTDPERQKVIFSYDSLDRLEYKTYPPPKNSVYPYIKQIRYVYDPNNNEEWVYEDKVVSSDGTVHGETTHKTYDDFNRIDSLTDRDQKTIGYTYDDAGNTKTVTDPDGKTNIYNYDDLNRLESVQTEDGLTQYTYYPDSMKKDIIYPNGTQAHYEYDKSNLVTKIYNHGSAGTISLYNYAYDNNGNTYRVEETQNGIKEVTTYDYDLVDRLTEITYPSDSKYPNGRRVTYTYDNAGNRSTEVEKDNNGNVLADKTFTYNELNWLTMIKDNLGSDDRHYYYDDNGNTISKTSGGITTSFLYDVKDYLRSVSNGTQEFAGFDYNYAGQRITKSGNEGEIRYIYDNHSVLAETDATGSTIAKYNYGDRLLSLRHKTQGTQYYLFAGLSSVSNLTDTTGSVQCSYKYDAWGNYRQPCSSSWNRNTFTGKEWDEETGLYYYGARFYDPEIGRFISQDPYLGDVNAPPSLHRYLYANDNPLTYVDIGGYISLKGLVVNLPYLGYQMASNFWGFFKGSARGVGNLVWEGFATVCDAGQFTYRAMNYAYGNEFERTRAVSSIGKAISHGAGPGDIAVAMLKGLVTVPVEYGRSLASLDPERIGEATFNLEAMLFGAKALKSSASNIVTKFEQSNLYERLSLMSKLEPGTANLSRAAGIQRGLRRMSTVIRQEEATANIIRELFGEAPMTETGGSLTVYGAKFRGTNGLNPAELYQSYNLRNLIVKSKILNHYAENLGENLLTPSRWLKRPKVETIEGYGRTLSGDIDVMSRSPVLQKGYPGAEELRIKIAAEGNRATGFDFDVFDVHTPTPVHGVLTEQLPGGLLTHQLPPGGSLTTNWLYGAGAYINKPKLGTLATEPKWVGARVSSQYLQRLGKDLK